MLLTRLFTILNIRVQQLIRQSPIGNRKSATPQSPITCRQSTINNRQSAIRNPQSAILFVLLLIIAPVVSAQQMADPEFNVTVERPAYKSNLPRVLFDEAHHNFHTVDGRYKPFVDLLVNDGYRVIRGRQNFSKGSLQTFKILIIANALGADEYDDDDADSSAFTEEECDAVTDWVRSGGNLLLIADHAPFGSAARNLAQRFGVEMSNSFTVDPNHAEKSLGNDGFITYSRENGLLAEHPITEGRNESEKIQRVISFTGQSLKGPENSSAFLKLSDSAVDKPSRDSEEVRSAAGKAQGIAFKFGKGRVVVLGEAGMLTAQLAGPERSPFGMNVPGIDNKQLVLNIMHWLSGLLR